MKKLPTMVQLMAARALIASRSDYGVPGTLRLGNPQAQKLVILTSLVYEGEFAGLAAFAFLMENPHLIASDAQVALVLARPMQQAVTANLNRLPAVNMGLDVPEYARADQLRDAFAGLRPLGLVDLQDHHSCWVIDVTADCDRLAWSLASDIRLSGLTMYQFDATHTLPFATLFNCPSVELLTWPVDVPGAKKAVILNALLVLRAVGCGVLDVQAREFPHGQVQYQTVGFIPSDPEGVCIDPQYLQPFMWVKKGTLLGIVTGGAHVCMPRDGYLCLGPSKIRVEPGRMDPLFYIARKKPLVETIPLLDEYDE